jgi:three-Cys-motif partner protein
MARDAHRHARESFPLFEISELLHLNAPELKVKQAQYPVWTENKARLIERYLYYFVLVTKHGVYIDGFAGPQDHEKPDTWAARLVLESEPPWLRQFYLFEKDTRQFHLLNALKQITDQQENEAKEPQRRIEIYHGDFNVLVLSLLASGSIKQTEATFCLLDQRTFECHWATVDALARYKSTGHKIELFYFLPNSWLNRALAAQKDCLVLQAWWGREDWEPWLKRKASELLEVFVRRFKEELGYQSVMPWPIYERSDGGKTMYYMIHATDHPAAPELMARAYKRAVSPKEPLEQLSFEFDPLQGPVAL